MLLSQQAESNDSEMFTPQKHGSGKVGVSQLPAVIETEEKLELASPTKSDKKRRATVMFSPDVVHNETKEMKVSELLRKSSANSTDPDV